MCGYMRVVRIRNELIRSLVKMAPIKDKRRETRLRWLGHVRRNVNATVRRCEIINILKSKREWDNPRRVWMTRVKKT